MADTIAVVCMVPEMSLDRCHQNGQISVFFGNRT